MKKYFVGACCALVCLMADAAAAFDASDEVNTREQFGPGCVVDREVDLTSSITKAEVRLQVAPNGAVISYAGGAYFTASFSVGNPSVILTGISITTTQIANCLDTDVSNVTNLIQNGADGTFETDNYIGFVFTLTEDAGGFTAGTYEFKVGSESLLPASAGDTPEDVIETALSQNLTNLLSAQPNLTGFLNGTRENGAQASADIRSGAGSLAFAVAHDRGAWAEVQGVWSDIDGSESAYVHGAVGFHRSIGANTLLGGMIQFDDSSSDTDDGDDVDLTGWLIGPYLVGQVPGQELFYDARLLVGRGTGDVVFASTGNSGSFDTERLVFTATLEGSYDIQTITAFPYVSVKHAEMRSDSFVDSGGVAVDETHTDIQQAELGLTLRIPKGDDGSLVLSPGVSAVASREDGEGQDARGKAQFGIYKDFGGKYLTVDAFYDGFGRDAFEIYGLTLSFEWVF